jgi:hypothetical protein
MVSQEWPLIPQLIQEIQDFKSWVQGYLKMDLKFLLTRPFGPKMYLVWMGKAHSDVVKDVNDEHYQLVHV